MRIDRTPLTSAPPYLLEALRERARTTGDAWHDAELDACARTAASEIEDHAGIALLRQSIRLTVRTGPGAVLDLVGPVAEGAEVAAVLIGDGGATEAVSAASWWLEAGRFPRLHLSATAPAGLWRITCEAGFGNDFAAVPADLALAVADQATALFDHRGEPEGRHVRQGLTLACARIVARWRRIRA